MVKQIISNCALALGYEFVSPELSDNPIDISDQILENLKKSDIVVADIAFNNPNVFFELSIRLALNKPLIIVHSAHDQIPFDLLNFPIIRIDNDNPELWENAQQKIMKQINAFDSGKFEQNKISKYVEENYIISEFCTTDKISEIETNAKEIWICSTTLNEDVDEDGDICKAVCENLKKGNKTYTYFLPRTLEIENNFRNFIRIHETSIRKKNVTIIPIPNHTLNLFEEIAIYDPSYGCENTSRRKGYTKLTIPQKNDPYKFDALYLKLTNDITQKLVTILGELKTHYSIFWKYLGG